MNLYFEKNCAGETYSCKYDENGKIQELYSHDKNGFKIESLERYSKKLITAACDLISSAIALEVFFSGELTNTAVENALEKVKRGVYDIDI